MTDTLLTNTHPILLALRLLETTAKEPSAAYRIRAARAILTGTDLPASDPAGQVIRSAAIKLRRESQAINRGMA